MGNSDLTKDDYEFVKKLIKELDESLSRMTEEERKKFFKKYGIEVIETDSSERKQQLVNLFTALKAVLELRKQSDSKPKTGMDEMIEELGLQGCLIPSPREEQLGISEENLRILGVQIDEDVRQCEQAMQESVIQLIKGPKM